MGFNFAPRAILAGCLLAAAMVIPAAAQDKTYTIYLSNGLIGNDWLQQMQRSAEVAVKKPPLAGRVDLHIETVENSAQAQINQQSASTQATRLNLQRTVIRSPVDGVVLSRSVEPGQTVAASLQAPVLFQIAEDLSQMEILLAVDEADIGQVKSGLDVAFTVDAFPERRFRGKVKQVRLAASNTSNVITYPVVVSVDNRDQALLPGMTANAEIEVYPADHGWCVPDSPVYNAAQAERAWERLLALYAKL